MTGVEALYLHHLEEQGWALQQTGLHPATATVHVHVQPPLFSKLFVNLCECKNTPVFICPHTYTQIESAETSLAAFLCEDKDFSQLTGKSVLDVKLQSYHTKSFLPAALNIHDGYLCTFAES